MFVALLIYCSLELKTCVPIVHKIIFKEEAFCYQNLAEGIKYYEDRGNVVPVYMCVKIGKENGEAT
jgi:hypothetical protein